MAATPPLTMARVNVRGIVQGVGFRPFVYQTAVRHHLRGWVCNTSEDVRIEIEGDAKDIGRFLDTLRNNPPPLSHIEGIEVTEGKPNGYESFEIRKSLAESGKYQLVSPDLATCEDCRKEIFDPGNRRYRYPFTNCTNCGPRFTIIADIPYDRPNTTMKKFTMCPACRREYEDPFDRRFHAQPNACPVCGPKLELLDSTRKAVSFNDIEEKKPFLRSDKDCHSERSEESVPLTASERERILRPDKIGTQDDSDFIPDHIRVTAELLKQGKIVAIKGLGGFLLACDATNTNAVMTLRERKKRPAKPFAVMLATIEEIRKHCIISGKEAELLQSAGSPIVLLPWKKESGIAEAVAPGLDYLGVMLPYTPLHHLLMHDTGLPLVMTSGNLSEEPICKDIDEALLRLGNIADYFLVHNRDIYSRYDDSVMIVELRTPRYVRRARGAAPYPVKLPEKGRQVLACGAEEKNTFCLTRDEYAFISQHIGDMENLETLEHFSETIELYQKLFRIQPEVIACDMHPEYLPTKYAKEQSTKTGLPLLPVQHHHAHIASCLADNGTDEKVIGVSMDGTGYGPDGHIWGGEFMVADCAGFERLAHLDYLPLPGGAQAIKKPYRAAIGYLEALGIEADGLPFINDIEKTELDIIREQVKKNINTPLTSSMGRLFDVVAAMTGIRTVIQYDAQAAIDLETAAVTLPGEDGVYPFTTGTENGITVVRLHLLLSTIVREVCNHTPQAVIAARFHNTVVEMIATLCKLLSQKTGLTTAALSGGVFQNRLLLRKTISKLESGRVRVYTHQQVPCNDGGISLGQAVIAQHIKEA